jgi:hypothetical protein
VIVDAATLLIVLLAAVSDLSAFKSDLSNVGNGALYNRNDCFPSDFHGVAGSDYEFAGGRWPGWIWAVPPLHTVGRILRGQITV